MPDALSTLVRLFSVQWNGLPVASLVLFAVGGVMYLAMARASAPATRSLARRSPGWIARRRARGGIAHHRGGIGVGYRSATAAVHLDLSALNHHGYVGGAPGSGKTTRATRFPETMFSTRTLNLWGMGS